MPREHRHIVAAVDAQPPGNDADNRVLFGEIGVVGHCQRKEKVHHVIARVVVGVLLYLLAHRVHIDISLGLHQIAQHAQQGLALLLGVVLAEKLLHIVQLLPPHIAVCLHHGGNQHQQGHVDVVLRTRVVETAMAAAPRHPVVHAVAAVAQAALRLADALYRASNKITQQRPNGAACSPA